MSGLRNAMICCGVVAMAASLMLAVGRRMALGLLIGCGVLLDPRPLMGHTAMLVCRATPG